MKGDKYHHYEVNEKVFYSYDEALQEYFKPESKCLWGFTIEGHFEVILMADNEENT